MRTKTCKMTVKAPDQQQASASDDGTFEAIVATYDLDSYGDKITPGAFADTLQRWKSSGNPIPVIWSHLAHDPDCHVGAVLEAEERDGQGLWVKGQFDLEQPKAAQVYRLLKSRRVTQFSFAYDIDEGALIVEKGEVACFELRKLTLYEVGPCLIGVNQNTELLDVKAATGDVRVTVAGHTAAQRDAVRVAVEAALAQKTPAVVPAAAEEPAPDPDPAAGANVGPAVLAAVQQIQQGSAALAAALTPAPDSPAGAAPSSDDDTKADQAAPATADEPDGAKASGPARISPASARLRAELAALQA